MKDYLAIINKFPIQSYAQRVNQATEKMGVPFLPPGVEESGRETDFGPVMQEKGREI